MEIQYIQSELKQDIFPCIAFRLHFIAAGVKRTK